MRKQPQRACMMTFLTFDIPCGWKIIFEMFMLNELTISRTFRNIYFFFTGYKIWIIFSYLIEVHVKIIYFNGSMTALPIIDTKPNCRSTLDIQYDFFLHHFLIFRRFSLRNKKKTFTYIYPLLRNRI